MKKFFLDVKYIENAKCFFLRIYENRVLITSLILTDDEALEILKVLK